MPETRHNVPPQVETVNRSFAAAPNVRVDAAHMMGRAADSPEMPAEAGAVPGGVPPDAEILEALPRLRVQGRQLAQLLQDRQRDLDHREAQHQAFAADVENQLRAARLWVTERQQELADRETATVAREQDAADRWSRLSAAEAYLDKSRRELEIEISRREQKLAVLTASLADERARLDRQAETLREAQQTFAAERQRERNAALCEQQQIDSRRGESSAQIRAALNNVERRRQAVEAEAIELERRRAQWAEASRQPSPEQRRHARELAEIASGLAEQEKKLVAAEQLQVRASAELGELRQQLTTEQTRLAEQARVDRRRIAESERAANEQAAQQREVMHRHNEQMAEREASLERLRTEVSGVHREALEARLAAEETLARFAGIAPTAEVAQAIAETRARLADHWRLAADRVAHERAELAALGRDVAHQADRLAEQRNDLAAWAERRQQEFDRLTAKLAEREESLDLEKNELRETREAWDRDRLAFEQQLRRTTAQWREGTQ